jgi:DNA-directed RNA polymerase subunit M/transcription elongation factor TFIIS
MMDLDDQVTLGHLLLQDRKCRKCGEVKNLIDGFYRTRKERGTLPSSYSYECKVCTIRRIVSTKKKLEPKEWTYPDW